MAAVCRRCSCERAFSLIELLVVIVILGVLAAILIPALGGVLDQLDMVECQSNMNQIAKAVLAYTTDQQGLIPASDFCAVNVGGAGAAYVGKFRRPLFWSNLLILGGYITAPNTGGFATDETTTDRNVFRCPCGLEKNVGWLDTANIDPDDDRLQGFHRQGDDKLSVDNWYFWNGQSRGEQHADGTWDVVLPSNRVPLDPQGGKNPVKFQHIGRIRKLSRTLMLADGLATNPIDPASAGTPKGSPNLLAARHPGAYGRRSSTNVAFYDGHTENMLRVCPTEGTGKRDWTQDPIIKAYNTDSKKCYRGAIYWPTDDPDKPGGPLYFRIDDQQ